MSVEVLRSVNEAYSNVARSGMDQSYAERVAKAFGYTKDELESIPAASNMGLSCGNPVATAHLRPGEHVVDLGSGGGLDVFLAAAKVGEKGQVVGLDMNEDMIKLARRNAAKSNMSPHRVAFASAQLGGDEPLPVQSGSVDCVLSNCVINLVDSARKPKLLSELYRILRPGGRLAIHDVLLKQELDESLRQNINLYVGCIAGAALIEVFRDMLKDAGFQDIVMVDTGGDLNVYFEDGGVGCCGAQNKPTSCCSEATAPAIDFRSFDANKYASSMSIFAVRPGDQLDMPLPDILIRDA